MAISIKQSLYLQEAADYCRLDIQFLESVIDEGILDINPETEEEFLDSTRLDKLKRIGRLHHLLGVNLPGIEVIMQMRERIMAMQMEMNELRRQLHFHRPANEHTILDI